ncbi:MAG: DUF4252 domain-containing protein [Acidobacteria bacterium]|nr:DUF4252 domain-containing protein [Acidobacteriota bacterium]
MNGSFSKKNIFKIGRVPFLFILAICFGANVFAQNARLEIGNLDKLAAKASDVVDVTVDENLLKLAIKFLSDKSPDEARIKEIVSGLKGVYVRVFEFDQPGQYSVGDVDALRLQLKSPGWSRIVGVRSRKQGENIDVHIMTQGDLISGLAIIAANPRELTVVNIVGPIDLEKLRQLEGQFGIPKLDIDSGAKPKPKNE